MHIRGRLNIKFNGTVKPGTRWLFITVLTLVAVIVVTAGDLGLLEFIF